MMSKNSQIRKFVRHLFLVVNLVGLTSIAQASTLSRAPKPDPIPVYNSIYLALGYPQNDPFANLRTLVDLLKQNTNNGRLERLSLVEASVSPLEREVTYRFFDVQEVASDLTCEIQVRFTISLATHQEPTLLHASAKETCREDTD